MVEVESEVQEELAESAIQEREALVKKKQYEFEQNESVTNQKKLNQKSKGFKKYLPWIIVFCVLVVLVVLAYAFGLF